MIEVLVDHLGDLLDLVDLGDQEIEIDIEEMIEEG
jgi:hypothetical protein